MKFAFLIMGDFDPETDHVSMHTGEAQMIGVSSVEEAKKVAERLLNEGIDCIELCGAFGETGAKEIVNATENKIPVGYAVHLPEQDEIYARVFPNG